MKKSLLLNFSVNDYIASKLENSNRAWWLHSHNVIFDWNPPNNSVKVLQAKELHCILDSYYSIYTFYLFQSFHFNTALWVISNQQWKCLGSPALCQIRHLVLHKNCGDNIKSVILIFMNTGGLLSSVRHVPGLQWSSTFFDKWDSQAWKRIFYALVYIASREVDPNVSQENVTFE